MEESAAPKLVAAGMEKVAATTGWAGKATARAEKWNGDVGKRKQKSHQEGTPHLEDRPDYNVKSFAPSPPRSPNPPPKAGCNDGPHPARIYYYISQTGSCGPASFFTGKRGPASGPPRSRLSQMRGFSNELRARLGPAFHRCVVFPMSDGPASVPPFTDAWFFQ